MVEKATEKKQKLSVLECAMEPGNPDFLSVDIVM